MNNKLLLLISGVFDNRCLSLVDMKKGQ